jgi:type I restriction enzyme S subunit
MGGEFELQAVAALVMGTSPKGDTYNHEGVGEPLLNGPTEFGPVHPDCTLYTSAPVRMGESGDLLFCVRGSTTGRMNWADRPYALGRGVAGIRGGTQLETRFIRYCLEARLEGLLKRAGGGTFPNLRQTDIATFPIPWPKEREKIAAVLAAYDELIENNLRRIEILEEMAQAVYREWFVKFRFPGQEDVALVDSPLGPIPEGWELTTVADAIELNPRVRLPRALELRFVPMGSLIEGSMVIEGYETRIGPSGSQFRNGDTLLARITPSLENGKTGFVQFLSEGEVACGSTEFIVMRSRTLTPEFVYMLARTDDFRGVAVKSMVGASGRQRVQESSISKYLFAHPDSTTLQRFHDVVSPKFRLVQNLVDQNANLRATRDLLLPKLVSGAIDVSDLDIDTEWLVS